MSIFTKILWNHQSHNSTEYNNKIDDNFKLMKLILLQFAVSLG